MNTLHVLMCSLHVLLCRQIINAENTLWGRHDDTWRRHHRDATTTPVAVAASSSSVLLQSASDSQNSSALPNVGESEIEQHSHLFDDLLQYEHFARVNVQTDEHFARVNVQTDNDAENTLWDCDLG